MLQLVKRNWIVLVAAILAAVFLATGRVSPAAAARAIDLDLLLVLFALLVSVEILRAAGYLDLAVAAAASRFTSVRTFVLALMLFSGALSAIVTNDVALFVVIPFTMAASRLSGFRLEYAVILEILAANLLGCLTPLGNPQNLFVFHQSGCSAGHFVMTMLPFAAFAAVMLVAALFLVQPPGAMAGASATLPPRNGRAAMAGAVTFALVLLEIARVTSAVPAAAAAAVAAIVFLRRRFFAIDLSIIPLFFCAFIVVAGLRTLRLGAVAEHLYPTAIVLSQVISNVPATVLLSSLAHGQWKTLLYGVSAGSCGTIIASLANLLGWRIYVRESGRDPRFFWHLTAISFAFLAVIGLAGSLLIRLP